MKNKLSILSLITILVATLIIAVSVVAQPSGDQPPPQEAITACKGKQQGATCQFTTSQGKVTGTLYASQQSVSLCACRWSTTAIILTTPLPYKGGVISNPKSKWQFRSLYSSEFLLNF